MASRADRRRERPPLDQAALDALALAYVGRFATTRARLADYLRRKLRERGWDGGAEPDPAAVAERLAGLGYVDDQAFAEARARGLLARGYGARRIGAALHAAGVGEADGRAARAVTGEESLDAALRFARRRRIGPFAAERADPRARDKAIGAMLRAGHPLDLARRIAALEPGADVTQLGDRD